MKMDANISKAMNILYHPAQQVAEILDYPEDYTYSDGYKAVIDLETANDKALTEYSLEQKELDEAMMLQHEYTLASAKERLEKVGLW